MLQGLLKRGRRRRNWRGDGGRIVAESEGSGLRCCGEKAHLVLGVRRGRGAVWQLEEVLCGCGGFGAGGGGKQR